MRVLALENENAIIESRTPMQIRFLNFQKKFIFENSEEEKYFYSIANVKEIASDEMFSIPFTETVTLRIIQYNK